MKSCIIDIETSSLSPQTGTIILACLLDCNTKEITTVKSTKGTNDKKTAVQIRNLLDKYDIIIGFNVLSFDLPFIQSRLLHWREQRLRPIFVIDLLRTARQIIPYTEAGPSRSLDNVTAFVNVPGKTRVSINNWLKATLDNDKFSLNEIENHCRADVEITNELLAILKPYVKQISRY